MAGSSGRMALVSKDSSGPSPFCDRLIISRFCGFSSLRQGRSPISFSHFIQKRAVFFAILAAWNMRNTSLFRLLRVTVASPELRRLQSQAREREREREYCGPYQFF